MVHLQNIKPILIILLSIGILSACVSKKQIIYFQKDENPQQENKQTFEVHFKKDDLLTIDVSAEDIISVKPFNLPSVAYGSMTDAVSGVPKQQTYLIDSRGEINFPVLGKIKLEGLSRVETVDLLIKKLDPDYVKSPSINIHILNFTVNVLGDVKKPGTYTIPNERVTILDALALAGDLNISGDRIISIKRESETGIITGTIDLRSNELFASPFYYLQQNDVVYVQPNYSKSQSAAYNQNTGVIVSVTSVIISLISILTR